MGAVGADCSAGAFWEDRAAAGAGGDGAGAACAGEVSTAPPFFGAGKSRDFTTPADGWARAAPPSNAANRAILNMRISP